MDINPDFHQQESPNVVLIPKDEYLIPKSNDDEQSIPMNDEAQMNQETHSIILLDENKFFEKAFNETFIPNQTNQTPYEEEEYEPIMQYKPEEISQIEPCKDERIVIKVEEEGQNFYPFTKGEGLGHTLEKIGLAANYNKNKINLSQIYNKQLAFNSKFKTVDYYTDEKGKKKKEKKKRKFKPDDIRKKIKAKFHKVIKNLINSKLKSSGSKILFDFLPQSFITNITIKLNNQSLNLTYENLIEKNFISQEKSYKGNPDVEKYNKNIEVLNYLKKNPEICTNSEFEKIKDMKYKDILKAYFNSLEFEQSIIELNNKKERIDYIEEYINKAITYVDFFANNKKGKNDSIKTDNNNNNEGCNKFKIYFNCDEDENKESY